MRRSLALLFAVILLLPGPVKADEVRTLIDKTVAAHGGKTALGAVKSLHATGTTSSLRLGVTGPSERWYAAPDRLRIAQKFPGGEDRLLVGNQSFKDGQPTLGPMARAMALQLARFRLPLLLTEVPVTAAGNEAGRTVLRAELGDGAFLLVDVDPKSGLIRRSRGYLPMGAQQVEFATDYDDYRKVGGVQIAHREGHGAMGMHTGETVLERIEINPALPASAFQP